MNIYMVSHKDDCYGYYISAANAGRAKMTYQSEDWDTVNYIDLRAHIVRKNVDLPDFYVLEEDDCAKYDLDCEPIED